MTLIFKNIDMDALFESIRNCSNGDFSFIPDSLVEYLATKDNRTEFAILLKNAGCAAVSLEDCNVDSRDHLLSKMQTPTLSIEEIRFLGALFLGIWFPSLSSVRSDFVSGIERCSALVERSIVQGDLL